MTIKPKNAYAFFDVDETVISVKSMFTFIELYFAQFPDKAIETCFYEELNELFSNHSSREYINKRYYSYFENFSINRVKTVCDLWFQHYMSKDSLYNKNVLKMLKAHQANNITCVFISGSFKELLQPIAQQLNIQDILCINLEKSGLMYTGNIIPPQTIGAGKAEAIKTFMASNHIDHANSYAYGDDISDAPMLEMVGNPRVVSGSKSLEEYAHNKSWKIIPPN